MSGQAVLSCVDALCAVYNDGVELVQHIQAKRDSQKTIQDAPMWDASMQELESSLNRGGSVIKGQFNRDYERFGRSFAYGDSKS